MYTESDFQPAKYLIRFDDLCPEMNRDVWNKIEKVLYQWNVKPILAVVPDNQDPHLKKQSPDPDFWKKIKKYQNDGFMIALHGYNHVYTNHHSGIMGISPNSEFATLPIDEQKSKIQMGLKIFNQHGIHADAFIAPSHSFDKNTLSVLRECTKIRIISDGHVNYPYYDSDFLWLPCQLWDVFQEKQKGLYTICIHCNSWTEKDFRIFEAGVKKYANRIISPHSVGNAKNINCMGKIINWEIAKTFQIKRAVKRLIKR